ncbi:DinB family protein [Arthrobacter tumbae]|uniref:DinB family protein n=1 Tax=Arthrobacter tumbae TaxID=163874 RepID=UPI00195BEDAD|nr:DinB family protein [Arthrobacter tumbae]MBM7780876.1 putative damage-inducible protein DinB [Arthrobacter tumbae]
MIDGAAKAHLHERHRDVREQLVEKLKGLSEYDVRRPMSRTGTNLLGLIKHLALYEAAYFGHTFGRPFPEQPIPTLDGNFRNRDFMWVTEHENRDDIMAAYQRACQHADTTIESLPIDAIGHVSWWHSDVTLFNVLLHMLVETSQHLGHADIIREGIDGTAGASTEPLSAAEQNEWATHWTMIETAARKAAGI